MPAGTPAQQPELRRFMAMCSLHTDKTEQRCGRARLSDKANSCRDGKENIHVKWLQNACTFLDQPSMDSPMSSADYEDLLGKMEKCYRSAL